MSTRGSTSHGTARVTSRGAPPHASPGPAPGTSLNAARRSRELEDLASPRGTGRPTVDVLVIGGGVTGTGVALDAASRGLSVVLAEKHDLAFGTSRWSSKLVHGGLRYLASGRLGIAHESAVERGILIRHTAPHLVRAFPQTVPLHPGVDTVHASLIKAGFLAGDALRAAARTPARTLPRTRRITATEVGRYAPTVRVRGLRGGLTGWDGQLNDDARLVVALARTAAGHGAKILTRVAASGATGEGALLTDALTGQSLQVTARVVINATGVWAGELAEGLTLRPSRGTHLVFSQRAFDGLASGLMIPVPGHFGRFVYALPAPDRRVYVGLTDEDAPGPVPDEPQADEAEIDFLLDTLNPALADRSQLTRGDLLGTFSGLRPLLGDGEGEETGSADISRKHRVITTSDGLLTIVGGKLTTYRRMAQDALDAGLAQAAGHTGGSGSGSGSGSGNPSGSGGGSGFPLGAGPCRTHRLPLVGAAGPARLEAVDAPSRLVRRYGTEAADVLATGAPEWNRPLSEATEVTPAELHFAVRHEGALDIGDLLDRRTRIGLVPAARDTALGAAQEALDAARRTPGG